jgi:hypothetical protein
MPSRSGWVKERVKKGGRERDCVFEREKKGREREELYGF